MGGSLGRGLIRAALVGLLMLAAAPAVRADHDHTRMEWISDGITNGAFPANWAGATPDASHVFFRTDERLLPGDNDDQSDPYEWRRDGTLRQVSIGEINGNLAFISSYVGSSEDGSRVFFTTGEKLTTDDTDLAGDIYERSGDVTTLITPGSATHLSTTWKGSSADGTRVFFVTREQLAAADNDSEEDIYEQSGGSTALLSTGSSGGNGAFGALYAGASSDGQRVFFGTFEPLVPGDTDTGFDVYERSGGVTSLVSTGPLGNGPQGAAFAGSSEDGSRVFFTTRDQLVLGDTDTSIDVYERSGGTTALRSPSRPGAMSQTDVSSIRSTPDGRRVYFTTLESLVTEDKGGGIDLYERFNGTTTLVSTGPTDQYSIDDVAAFGAVSADGGKVFFTTSDRMVAADTDSEQDVYERLNGTTTRLVSTGPTGGNGTFLAQVLGASEDGSRVFFRTSEQLAGGDTDTASDVYERKDGVSTTRVSVGPGGGNVNIATNFAMSSTDGTRVVLTTVEALMGEDNDSVTDVYMAQTAPPAGYPRPAGASPLRVSLVPAYTACSAPNRTHGPPLAFGSCAPPSQASPWLTVGTPDANGEAPNASGLVRLGTVVGPGDSDVGLELSAADVRCQGTSGACPAALADYAGELDLQLALRITDRNNDSDGGGGTEAGTVSDLSLAAVAPCTPTGSTATGSTCALSTTIDAIAPGAVREGKRSIWELGQITLQDGGSDGAASAPNAPFMRQGVFIP